MTTKAQILEQLLIERFTHLPQSPPMDQDTGPSAELIRQRRHDVLEAAHVIVTFPDRPDVLIPVIDEHPHLAAGS